MLHRNRKFVALQINVGKSHNQPHWNCISCANTVCSSSDLICTITYSNSGIKMRARNSSRICNFLFKRRSYSNPTNKNLTYQKKGGTERVGQIRTALSQKRLRIRPHVHKFFLITTYIIISKTIRLSSRIILCTWKTSSLLHLTTMFSQQNFVFVWLYTVT